MKSEEVNSSFHEWPSLSLREAGISLIDCEHRTPPPSDNGYPYVAIPQIKEGRIDLSNVRRITHEHLLEWTRKAQPEPHDVVLSRRCNPGETAYVPFGLEFAIGQNLVLLRSDGKKVYKPFLRWLVRGPEWWNQVSKNINVGAVFDSLKCADIPNFVLPIPPMPEQKSMARIFGVLDSKIELNQQMNKTLEAIAQAIFKHWFVDFEFPNEEGKPYRSSGGEMAYSKELERDLPKEWKTADLPEVASVIDCLHTKKPDPIPSDFLLLQVYNINVEEATINLTEKYAVSDSDYKTWTQNIEVSTGDCIITNAGIVGAIAQIPLGFRGGIGRNITAIRPRGIPPTYLLRYLKSSYGRREIERHTDQGTIFNSLNVKGIRKIRILVPPSGVLNNFEAICRPFRERVERNNFESSSLGEIRDSLLPKLMSGKIRVPVEVR